MALETGAGGRQLHEEEEEEDEEYIDTIYFVSKKVDECGRGWPHVCVQIVG